MPKLVLPRVQAMVVCDRAKESESELDVFRLLGVRSSIQAASFPAFHPRLCAFAQISGHQGEAYCHVEVIRIDTDEEIAHTSPKKLTFRGPTFIVPAVFRMRNCVFPAPGLYYVQVYNERKLITERPLRLLQEE
jgi:hypothetical protein